MTASPHTIGDEQSIAEAGRRMAKHQIRHLPVLRGGQLVGILSDRDVRLVEGLSLPELAVGEAMSTEVFTAEVDDSLGEVVAAMSTRKIGSVVVRDRGAIVGIYTTTDALGLLSRLLVLEELRGKDF